MLDSNNAKSIIIIDLLYLGDLMFVIPFIKELRKNFPDARIDMIINSSFFSIIEGNTYLDNVYLYNKNWTIKESINFAKNIRLNTYDLGLNIHGNWRTALLLKLINPNYSIGYGGKGKGIFLDKVLKQASDQHMVVNYLDFLRDLDLKVEKSYPQLYVFDKEKTSIQKKLQTWGITDNDKLIALNTGGTWPTKRWPVEGFAELADKLNKDCAKVVFIGSKDDLQRVEKIVGLMETEPIIATGKTSLKELPALLELCNLVISNDSGPVHVAAAVGTPTITIFGPSDDRKYRPLGDKHEIVYNEIECRPCGEHECPIGHHKCMQDIRVDDIIKVVNEMGCF